MVIKLIKGKTYYTRYNNGRTAIIKCKGDDTFKLSSGISSSDYFRSNSWESVVEREATLEETNWLNFCIAQDKYISLEDFRKSQNIDPEYVKCISIGSEIGSSKLKLNQIYKVFPDPNKNYQNGYLLNNEIKVGYHDGEFDKYFKISTESEYLTQQNPDKEVKPVNMQDIIKECKLRFPIGTRFKCANGNKPISAGGNWDIENNCWYVKDEVTSTYSGCGWLYFNGKYAEIVSLPEEKKKKYEVVHCKTQKELDFVINYLKYPMLGESINIFQCVDLTNQDLYTLQDCKMANDVILSFSEWCNKNSISMKAEDYKTGDWVVMITDSGRNKKGELGQITETTDRDFRVKTKSSLDNSGNWCVNHDVRKALQHDIPNFKKKYHISEFTPESNLVIRCTNAEQGNRVAKIFAPNYMEHNFQNSNNFIVWKGNKIYNIDYSWNPTSATNKNQILVEFEDVVFDALTQLEPLGNGIWNQIKEQHPILQTINDVRKYGIWYIDASQEKWHSNKPQSISLFREPKENVVKEQFRVLEIKKVKTNNN